MGILTSRVYERELADLKLRLVSMGRRCEDLIDAARLALMTHNARLADQIAAQDREVDKDETAIDEMAVRILALRQPRASDLRFLVATLKVVTELERVGDEAVNLAERAGQLAQAGTIPGILKPLVSMTTLAQELLRASLVAFVRRDPSLAHEVIHRDDEVDAFYGEVTRSCMADMKERPDRVSTAMCLASSSKHLERIGDHTSNIAAMAVFTANGEDVRRLP